ncbi:MAG: hypothetical protein LC804_04680 [Acidobacteria bacterium]|nr:hypothetical protein [Acidobacteriota bacterium]
MGRTGKFILSVFFGIVICVGLGFAWASAGRVRLQSALDESRENLDLAEARGHLLEARVSLYNVNFGDASAHFEVAKPPLRRIRQRYQDAGKNDAAGSIGAALEHVDEAQRLAGKLDASSNTKAGEALEAIRVATSKR